MPDRIIERLEYKTQIHTSWDGSEQRMALRSEPRRFVSYDYVGVETWHNQYLRMLTYGKQTQLIQFPLWHAQCIIPYKIYANQTNLRIPIEAIWGYRNIGAVMFWVDDEQGGVKYDLEYITSNGLLGLKKAVRVDWQAYKTLLVPVFWGVLDQESDYENVHSDLVTMTVNVEFIRNQNAPEFPTAYDKWHPEKPPDGTYIRGLPDQYMSVEVFKDEPPWLNDMNTSYSKNANRLDNETGVFRFDLKSTETSETRQMKYAGLNRAECYNFQRFFMRQKGMLKSFYAPTWLNDLELAGDMQSGQIYLLLKFNAFWKYYASSRRRRTIVIFYTNGSCEILKIAGYSVDDTGKYGKVYLENSLKRTIYRRQVRMISFFCRYRFASDTLTVDYETNTSATMELSFKEVDE